MQEGELSFVPSRPRPHHGSAPITLDKEPAAPTPLLIVASLEVLLRTVYRTFKMWNTGFASSLAPPVLSSGS